MFVVREACESVLIMAILVVGLLSYKGCQRLSVGTAQLSAPMGVKAGGCEVIPRYCTTKILKPQMFIAALIELRHHCINYPANRQGARHIGNTE